MATAKAIQRQKGGGAPMRGGTLEEHQLADVSGTRAHLVRTQADATDTLMRHKDEQARRHQQADVSGTRAHLVHTQADATDTLIQRKEGPRYQ